MPEVCEIVVTAQFIMSKIGNCYINSINIISGRYTHQKMEGVDLIIKYSPLQILNVDSKGKFMWFDLYSKKYNKHLYIMNTFGLSGSWSFENTKGTRILFSVVDNKKNHVNDLYFNDNRNFGTIKITDNLEDLDGKLEKLAPDLLKTKYSLSEFKNWFRNFKYQDREIIKVLMNQEVGTGIGSGLGNYLAPEILYRSKISPYRKIESLTDLDIADLYNETRKTLKLCYLSNHVGYMTQFEDYIQQHKIDVEKGILPDFQKKIKLKKNDKFDFFVYQRKKDPYGNDVVISKIIKDRSTYWVPCIQK